MACSMLMTVAIVQGQVEPSSCEDICLVFVLRLEAQTTRVAAAGDLLLLTPDSRYETFGVDGQSRCLESRPPSSSAALETMPKKGGVPSCQRPLSTLLITQRPLTYGK